MAGDFAVAQHTDRELSRKHLKVADAFRGARPRDVFGRRKFEKSANRDMMSVYVCNEVVHHATEACRLEKESEELRLSWLTY